MSERSPLLSVCIPTFNRARFLIPCLDSFICQIGRDLAADLEIIISDNKSYDGTRHAVTTLSKEHGYVHYFRNETNVGAERNVFEALGRARGAFSWIFGDDDLVLKGSLEKVVSLLRENRFDFYMLNKVVRSADLSTIILERQTDFPEDVAYSDIKDLCCELGFYTNLGFLSGVVFRREPCVATDPGPYLALGTLYPHNGVWLEAFNCRPCLYVSDVLVCHRQFNSDAVRKAGQYIFTVPVIRMFKLLASKQVLDYSFVEQIRESPLNGDFRTIVDMILAEFEFVQKWGYTISADAWRDVMEVFSGFKSEAYKRRIAQIYSRYQSTSSVKRHAMALARRVTQNPVVRDYAIPAARSRIRRVRQICGLG